MWDQIRQIPREVGYRYFVRGDIKPRLRRHVPTDFGDGIYVWDDHEEGLLSAVAWAAKKVAPVVGSAVGILQLLRVSSDALDGMRVLHFRSSSTFSETEWQRMVEWYRQQDAAPGPLDDFDLVSGPQATQKAGNWKPTLQYHDQYRFLPRMERHIELVLEIELE